MFVLGLLIEFAAAFLLIFLGNWIGLRPWRRAFDAHWTERARLLWPVRRSAAGFMFLVPIYVPLMKTIWCHHLSPWWAMDLVAAYLGSLAGCYPLSKEIFPRTNFKTWAADLIQAKVISFSGWAMFVGCAIFMPMDFGWGTIVVAAIFLLWVSPLRERLMLRYFYWRKLIKPADERLGRILSETSAQTGIHPKAAWQTTRDSLAGAYALTRLNELLFTNRLLEISTDEEIAAICCHELAHLTEPKSAQVGRWLGTLAWFPLIFSVPVYNHWPAAIIPLAASVFVIAHASRHLSSKMEARADQIAAEKQKREGVYAQALEKLYRDTQLPAVIGGRKTHPDLYDRMVAAGITPDFPRPVEPDDHTTIGAVFQLFVIISVAGLYIWVS